MTSNRSRQRLLLFAGVTLVVISFFTVWLPHAAAGLAFLGLELGEEAKFLPAVRAGQIIPGRSLFYLPPVTAALALLLESVGWSSRRWQTWAIRGMAILLSLLAFPALEALGTEPAEWLWRLLMILLVVLVAILSPAFSRLPRGLVWSVLALVAIVGAVFPLWIFLEVRAAFNALLPQASGFGPGVWLNLVGQFLILIYAWQQLGVWPATAVPAKQASRGA